MEKLRKAVIEGMGLVEDVTIGVSAISNGFVVSLLAKGGVISREVTVSADTLKKAGLQPSHFGASSVVKVTKNAARMLGVL